MCLIASVVHPFPSALKIAESLIGTSSPFLLTWRNLYQLGMVWSRAHSVGVSLRIRTFLYRQNSVFGCAISVLLFSVIFLPRLVLDVGCSASKHSPSFIVAYPLVVASTIRSGGGVSDKVAFHCCSCCSYLLGLLSCCSYSIICGSPYEFVLCASSVVRHPTLFGLGGGL